jgi:hypothetical protein
MHIGRYAVAGIRRGMRQARAQRSGDRRGRGGHTEQTPAPAPALTLANYPLLTATVRADGGDATTTTGDASGGEATAARVHAHGGADGCAVA